MDAGPHDKAEHTTPASQQYSSLRHGTSLHALPVVRCFLLASIGLNDTLPIFAVMGMLAPLLSPKDTNVNLT